MSWQILTSSWYRQLLKAEIPPLIEAWEPRLNVVLSGFYVQRMKTKWGSCNPAAGTIRLNTELAKKPKECLEYVVVHELAHLIERHHNERFFAIMGIFQQRYVKRHGFAATDTVPFTREA